LKLGNWRSPLTLPHDNLKVRRLSRQPDPPGTLRQLRMSRPTLLMPPATLEKQRMQLERMMKLNTFGKICG